MNKNIKQFIELNKFGVERFQWAIMNSIASLVYTEYIRNIRKKQYPREHTLIPPIKSVESFLNIHGDFMNCVSNNIIKDLMEHHLVQMFDHNKVPDLKILDLDNMEMTQTLLDEYILPNVSKRVPETISIKFQIGKPEVKGIMDESPEIDIFKSGVQDFHYEYILEETALQLLDFIIHPSLTNIESHNNAAIIEVYNDSILVIDHSSAICPIHLSNTILANGDLMDIIGSAACIEILYPIREGDNRIVVISKNERNCLYKYP